MKSLVLGTALFGIWLLWSGHLTPLLISFGVISCLLVVLLSNRMEIVDDEGVPVQLGLRPFMYYAPWLLKKIVEANIEVAGRILHPSLPIQPCMVMLTASQKEDLGRVIYANSITLTPGTVSVDMEGDQISVHALFFQGAAEDMSGEMDRRVSKLEASS